MLDEKQIATSIKKVLKAKNMSLRELAEKMHYDHGNVSRLLSGKRRLTLVHLMNICSALEIDIADLFPSEERVPIVSAVNGDGTFDYSHVESRSPIHGYSYLPMSNYRREREEFKDIKSFYGLVLAEDFGNFPAGSILIFHQGGQVRSGDFVVYPRESGLGVIGQSILDDDGLLITHPPNDIRLPKTHARLCDKLVSIIFP